MQKNSHGPSFGRYEREFLSLTKTSSKLFPIEVAWPILRKEPKVIIFQALEKIKANYNQKKMKNRIMTAMNLNLREKQFKIKELGIR